MAWSCNGSSVAPMSDYVDNPIFQQLPDQETYFSVKSDERIYLHLRASSGYVKEAEKLERHDSKINLQITLKNSVEFKSKNLGVLTLRVFICFIKKRSNLKT